MKEDYLLKKWLNNTLTPEEETAFKKLENYTFYNEIVAHGKHFKVSSPVLPETPNVLQKQHKLFYLKDLKVLWRVAAILVVAVGLFFLLNPKTHSFKTEIATKTHIVLPDSSTVELNENSLLQYSKNWQKQRQLTLKGEAYFKVKKGQTFEVQTNLGKVQVLGTQFNVFIRDSIFNVVCYEGKVNVITNTDSYILKPSQALTFNTKTATRYNVNVSQPVWLNNMSVFEAVPVQKVIEALKAHYHIKIDYSQVNTNMRFTGAFSHDNLEDALNAVTKALSLTFEKRELTYVILPK